MSDDEKKIRVNKNLTRAYVALGDEVTEIEYCTHDSDFGILIIPPDPNWGGTMDTNIVDKLFTYFDKQEITTMRFSFSKYQIFNNNYDKYITQAAICLEEFLRVANFSKKTWVVGYSFGSLIGLNLSLRRPDIQGVIMISPPLLNYDFVSWFIAFNSKVLIIYGTRDHLVPENIMDAYVKYLSANKMDVSLCFMMGANHYLQNKTDQIARECVNFINNSNIQQENNEEIY